MVRTPDNSEQTGLRLRDRESLVQMLEDVFGEFPGRERWLPEVLQCFSERLQWHPQESQVSAAPPSDHSFRFFSVEIRYRVFPQDQTVEILAVRSILPPGRRPDDARTITAADSSGLILFSERGHLSGVTVRLRTVESQQGKVTVELSEMESDGRQPLRKARFDLGNLEADGIEHLYWEPIAASKGRFFRVRVMLSPNNVPENPWNAPLLLEARLIHSQPEPYQPLPQALLFSPVSQCNLHCTHCISRPTRSNLRIASEATWDAVREITRGENFGHLATDYSGDILFDERRYPGTLARIIALNARFRIDTHANCLDDDIVDMLFGSKLWEINFSIDSMDPEIYGRIRRGSIPLAAVLAKIARFMDRKRRAQRTIHTIISFVLMRSNAATIKPALAFARENGIDHVNVFPLLAFTEDMVDEIFVWDEVAYTRLYEELVAEAARLGVALAIASPVQRWREGDIHAPCEVPWATLAITGNGDVMACCMPGTVVGNLNEQTLDAIWNGPEFASFRMRVNSPHPPAACRNCGMSRVPNNPKAYAPVRYARPVFGPPTAM
jgi:radical SAM protein with 4Fe4S-binding SPASM domain